MRELRRQRHLGFAKVAALPALAGALLALAVPTGASAATTVGASLGTAPGGTLNCTAFTTGCTASNDIGLSALQSAPGGVVSPLSGVVTRWRVRGSATTTMPMRLQILRPGSATSRASIRASAVEAPVASTTSTFQTRLAINAGDAVGVSSKLIPFVTPSSSPGLYWSPSLVEGAPASGGISLANTYFPINADVEPDADGDGYGDESQDLCPEQGFTHDRCQRSLTVLEEPGVRVTGPGIDCPGDCGEGFLDGDHVDLTAIPERGYAITNHTWGAPCVVSTPAVCSLVMSSNVIVSALLKDRRPPQTVITKKPRKRTHKRKVTIKFSVDVHIKRYECALDTKKFKQCNEPFRTRVGVGKHVFLVRGVRRGGIVDPTPAKAKWKVLPRR